jgi:hypothetical protein
LFLQNYWLRSIQIKISKVFSKNSNVSFNAY